MHCPWSWSSAWPSMPPAAWLFLHSHNILHRDLKSLNLLVGQDWVVKISDFGLSRIQATEMTGHRGTVPWMAPEVLGTSSSEKTTYTERSDVYSFGLTLNEMMTRNYPFHYLDGEAAVKAAILAGRRPYIPDHTPPAFAKLITDCWNHHPDERPSFVVIVNTLEHMLAKHRTKKLALGKDSSLYFVKG